VEELSVLYAFFGLLLGTGAIDAFFSGIGSKQNTYAHLLMN